MAAKRASHTDTRREALSADLDLVLREVFALQPCPDDESFGRSESGCFRMDAKLRIAEHFDLDWGDVLVWEPVLGALGIVVYLDEWNTTQGSGEPQSLASRVTSAVDRATYVRHLAITHKARANKQPISVDLVLVSDRESGLLDQVNAQLRHYASESAYLFAIGLHLLETGTVRRAAKQLRSKHHKPGQLELRALHRSLCWLMRACGRWWQSMPKSAHGESEPTLGKIKQIKLENYRLAGTRKLTFLEPGVASQGGEKLAHPPPGEGLLSVHVVLGHNGTGKSAITEAIEFRITGRADRLERSRELRLAEAGNTTASPNDYYDSIIRNSNAQSSAKVTIEWEHPNSGASKACKVSDANLNKAIVPGLCASSFRLDQAFMDRLLGDSDGQRAQAFLEAFFPDAKDTIDELQSVNVEVRSRIAVLPDDVWSSSDDPDDLTKVAQFLERWAWTDAPSPPEDAQAATALLGAPADLFSEDLGSIDWRLRNLFGQAGAPRWSWRDWRQRLDEIERIIEGFLDDLPQIEADLARAEGALSALSSWHVGTRHHSRPDFVTALNGYLEAATLAEMGTARERLARTVTEASRHGWDGADQREVLLWILPDAETEALASAFATWSGRSRLPLGTAERPRLARNGRFEGEVAHPFGRRARLTQPYWREARRRLRDRFAR